MKKLFLALLLALPFAAGAQTGKSAPRPLFDKKTIGDIRLTLPVKNWVDALDSMRIYGMGMLTGKAVVDGQTYEGVGVRFRGDKSYQMGLKRNPLTIKLNHTDPEASHQGYPQLKLSSALRDPSLVREMLFLDIASKYVPAPQASYSKLYINGEYVGAFVNVESIDHAFLERNYGAPVRAALFKAGTDYKPETLPATCRQNIFGALEYEDNLECYRGNFETNADQAAWTELQELTRVLNREPTNLERILDVDRALWMLALNNVMVNLSSYTGTHSTNYYLYADKEGRFQLIPWDLNLAFGSFKNTGVGSDLELADLQQLDPLLHADNPYKPLISQLLKDNFYRKVYLAHMRQILEENFLNGWYEKRAKELQAIVVVPFNDDKNKSYSYEDFKSSLTSTVGKRSRIPGIVELMSKRARFLKNHAELTALPSAISDVSVQGRGKYEKEKLNTFHVTAKADRFPKRMWMYYRFAGTLPYTVMAMDEEASTDLPSGVKQFSGNITAPSEDAVLEYYILAENAGTVSYLPTGYMTKPFRTKLADLNK
jgi:hypothetical protein